MRNVMLARLSRYPVLIAGLIWIVPCHAAADACTMWTDSAEGYAICLPDSWGHTVTSAGKLILCDQRKGVCAGGNPSAGHATVSVLPLRDALGTTPAANTPAAAGNAAPATIEEFAHRVADKDRTSQFTQVVTVTNFYAPIRYVLVAQTAVSGDPQTVMRYFVEANGKMMEFLLTFNLGDNKGPAYEDKVLKMIESIRPK